jgi:enterochelin esterase family protein
LQERFTNELLKDVIPYVEKNYRVRANPQSRAIAGLSMGGGQTLRVVTGNPNKFAYAAIWSAGVGQQNTPDFEKRNAAFLENSARINKQMKLCSIRVGEKDFALASSKNLSEILNKHVIKHDLHLSGGGHTWINWRQYLHEYAPTLFR